MAEIAAIATVVGSLVSASGTIAAGKAQQSEANYEAAQLDAKGKEEQAAAQRDADVEKRKKDLTLSKLQNNAAASGFSATDPTALNIGSDIERYGTYQEQLAEYGGQEKRAGYEADATAKRATGAAARSAATTSAFSTILGGIGSLAKYNPSAPSAASATSSYRYG